MKKRILFALGATAVMASAQANIDDFEDGNGLAETGGKNDAWYAYTDENDGGGSSYTNEEDQYGLVVVIPEAAAGGSEYGAGLTGIKLVQGTNENDPYVTLGLNVEGGLTGCTSISYKYKGAAHNLKVTMSGDEKGAKTGYNRHAKSFVASASWSNASATKAQLVQDEGWGKTVALNMANVVQLAWEVKGDASPGYLYIDDVNCAGYSGGGSSSGPTVTPTTAVVIDDFEDGNTTAEALGKTAYWYLYDAGGSFTNTKDTKGNWDMLIEDANNSYIAMMGISGITPGDTTYPSVGMEIEFDVGVLSGCSAITYDYRGSGHHMRASVTGVKANSGYEHVAPDENSSMTWKTVTVSSMEQPEWVAEAAPSSVKAFAWSKVSKLTWVVDEKLTAANLGDELHIDNVKCVGTLPTTTTAKSSSSAAAIRSSSSNAIGFEAPAAPAHFKAVVHGNTLQMTLEKAGLVNVQVFNMMGNAIESHSENMAAGSFAHKFNAMPQGTYVVRVQQGSSVKVMKMQIK